MPNQNWAIVARVPTFSEAEVIKLLLETENVETDIQAIDSINPTAGFNLLVEADLVHRAKWILKNQGITNGELSYLATGELQKENQNTEYDKEQ
jgi:hypothetical protein